MAEKSRSLAIRDFLGEAEEIVERLSNDLMALGNDLDSGGENDPENLNSIFRGAHSIKGLAGMFGFDDISELAHQMENLLDSLRLGKVNLDGNALEALFEALEALTRLVQGKGEKEDFTLDIKALIERINRICSGKVDAEDDFLKGLALDREILNVLTEYEEHRLRENLKKGRNILVVKVSFSFSNFDQELAEISDLLKKDGEIISTLPSTGEAEDRIGFQLLYGTFSPVEKIREMLSGTEAEILFLGKKQATKQRPEAENEPNPAAESDPSESSETESSSARSLSRTVRVDIDKLDSLMNVVGELVISKGAISEICERLKIEGTGDLPGELQKATRNLQRRLDELQKGVMEVRMVPVGQLFDKMTRIVRRVTNELQKKVTLDIRGGETELDKLIVEDLSDPLMHLIRNAIDHGIETPGERVAVGKDEKGAICLWASQKGNHVVIEVRDDGRGVDMEKVRRKALEKGLISEGDDVSRDALLDLLFTPGFSTRDEVSDISGRGVGMDVVRNNISSLSGMIEVDSAKGLGTSVVVTLPITLAIIKALIVRVGETIYAIPINSVLETLMVEAASIRTIERKEVIELRNSTLPLLRLGEIFNLSGLSRGKRLFIAVVGLAEKRMGIVVDELLGQQDVVIKSLGSALSFVRGIAGAADLGNQKTILVLDVGGLMNEALRGDSVLHV